MIDDLRNDLKYLLQQLEMIHPDLYRFCDKDQFYQDFSMALSNLTVENYSSTIMKLLAKFKDPHTSIDIPAPESFVVKKINNKYYIIDDYKNENSNVLYKEITKINNIKIEDIVNMISQFVSFDIEPYLNSEIERLLVNSAFLKQILKTDKINITCQDVTIDLDEENSKQYYKTPQKFEHKFLNDERTYYIKYQKCQNPQNYGQDHFFDEILNDLNNPNINKVIVDLRNNSGGNSNYFEPILKKIKKFSNVVVLVNNRTFSSAYLALVELKRQGAVIVGDYCGQAKNNFGDCKKIILPNTGLSIFCSSAEFINIDNNIYKITAENKNKYKKYEDFLNSIRYERETYPVDVVVEESIDDYKNQIDKTLLVAQEIGLDKSKLASNKYALLRQKKKLLDRKKKLFIQQQLNRQNEQGLTSKQKRSGFSNVLIPIIIISIVIASGIMVGIGLINN